MDSHGFYVGSNPTGDFFYSLYILRFFLFIMYYLISIVDDFQGFLITFLDLIIVLCILSGIFIIISKNPIISVLHLILLFSSVSCYLIFLGIKFIGISYLLVYVGAVSILFLFILMLINIRISELISDTNNSIPLAILVILAFFIPYNDLLPGTKTNFYFEFVNIDKYLPFVSLKH